MKIFSVLLFLFCWAYADPFQNNRFINVSGWNLLGHKNFELGFEYRPYTLHPSEEADIKTFRFSAGFDYGYNQNFDISVFKSFDSDDAIDSNDIKPFYELRYKLNIKWTPAVLGVIVDSDKDNFHTFYMMFKHIGIGTNFGGNEQKGGIAHYGGYNLVEQEVQKFFVILGGEWDLHSKKQFPLRLIADYNGDAINLGFRFIFNKNNALLFNWQRKGDYTDLSELAGKEAENWFFTYTLHL